MPMPRRLNTLCMTLVATWALATTRYYAADYVNGNDGNTGYSDTSMAAAGAVAVKTLTRLREIIPDNGEGRIAVCAVRGPTSNVGPALTYYKSDGTTVDDLDLRGTFNYRYILLRTTQDFTNNATDKNVCAPVMGQVGPGVNGEWTVSAGATVNTFSVSSGTLTAKPGLYGMRVRFTGNVTAGLANQCRNIWKNTSGQIVLGRDTSVAPAAGDTFYIERPGVIFDQFYSPLGTAGGNSSGFQSTFASAFVGFRCTQSTNVTNFINGPGLTMTGSFLEFDGRLSCGVLQSLRLVEDYPDETNTIVVTGAGLRWSQNTSGSIVTGTVISQLNIFCSALVGGSGTSCTIQRPLGTSVLFQGGYCSKDINIHGARPSGGHGVNVGNLGTSNYRRAYLDNAYIGPGQSSGIEVRGVDSNNCVGKPCIKFQSTVLGSLQFIDDLVSTDGGNTDVVIDVSGYSSNQLAIGTRSPVTATATLGDVRTADGTIISFAAIAADQYVDTKLNTYYGATGNRITRRTPGIFYNVPILGADPTTPLDGDTWITNIAGVRNICVRIAGATYRSLLT